MKQINSQKQKIPGEKLHSTFYFLLFIFCLILLSTFYFLFSTASAAGLVPCGEEGNPCSFCHLFQLGQNVLKFLMEISSVLAIAFIVYGGIMMMLGSGNPAKIKESQGIIWSAIIGIVILACSWVIINTFFHLMTGKIDWPWDEIQCKV
ncbi:MAG: pilin [Patescibacteria group bacterium]